MSSSDDLKEKDRQEYVKNLVSLWTNQNTLVYSRLANISAVQIAVFAGWYSVYKDGEYVFAALVGVIGGGLSVAAYCLVDCDLAWKASYAAKIRTADKRLFPDGPILLNGVPHKPVQGYMVMRTVAVSFIVADALLTLFALYTKVRPYLPKNPWAQ